MIPCSHRHASDLADELAQDRVPEVAEIVDRNHERAGPPDDVVAIVIIERQLDRDRQIKRLPAIVQDR